MRRPIIAGNWKMHKTIAEALPLVKELTNLVGGAAEVDTVVCPPFTALSAAREALGTSGIKLGAQNVHFENQGAFTGEISPVMLKDAGCEYVIIGHSERRQYFGETDETVNKKLKAALANGLTPIMCVGESLAQREAGETTALVASQVTNGIKGLTAEQVTGMVVAYEPIWAIGTGRTASADDANAVCALVRKTIAGIYGAAVAEKTRIQYGGSVKPDNIAELMAKSDIDGALVGGASLDAAGFAKIVKY
jgi:triosephosphate isomerase